MSARMILNVGPSNVIFIRVSYGGLSIKQLGELAGFPNEKPVDEVVYRSGSRQHSGDNAVLLPDAMHSTGGLGVVHWGPRAFHKYHVRAFALGPHKRDGGSRRLNVTDENA